MRFFFGKSSGTAITHQPRLARIDPLRVDGPVPLPGGGVQDPARDFGPKKKLIINSIAETVPLEHPSHEFTSHRLRHAVQLWTSAYQPDGLAVPTLGRRQCCWPASGKTATHPGEVQRCSLEPPVLAPCVDGAVAYRSVAELYNAAALDLPFRECQAYLDQQQSAAGLSSDL